MAAIYVLIDQKIRDEIDHYCEITGQTLSEYVRGLIRTDLIKKSLLGVEANHG